MNIVRLAYPNSFSCYTLQGATECEKCKYVVTFGTVKYCGFTPPRCTLHEVIKGAYDASNSTRRCILCVNYHRNLSSNICSDCLATEHLDKFMVQPDIAEAEWYRNACSVQEEKSDAN